MNAFDFRLYLFQDKNKSFLVVLDDGGLHSGCALGVQQHVPGRQCARLSGEGSGRCTDPVGPCDGHCESTGEHRRLLSILGPLSGRRAEHVLLSFFHEKGRRFCQKISYNNNRSTSVPIMSKSSVTMHIGSVEFY